MENQNENLTRVTNVVRNIDVDCSKVVLLIAGGVIIHNCILKSKIRSMKNTRKSEVELYGCIKHTEGYLRGIIDEKKAQQERDKKKQQESNEKSVEEETK